MFANKREKFLGLGVLAVALLFLADAYLITPYFARLDELSAKEAELTKTLTQSQALAERKDQLQARLKEALDGGLANTLQQQESAALHALRDWAGKSGMNLVSMRPEKTKTDKDFKELMLSLAGTGRLESLTGFLEKLESSPLPLRIEDLTIGSRKDGENELLFNLRMSALCYLPEKKTGKSAAKAESKEAGNAE